MLVVARRNFSGDMDKFPLRISKGGLPLSWIAFDPASKKYAIEKFEFWEQEYGMKQRRFTILDDFLFIDATSNNFQRANRSGRPYRLLGVNRCDAASKKD